MTIRSASRIIPWSILALAMVVASTARSQAAGDETSVLKQIDVTKGICVLLDDSRCEQAIRLAKSSELLLYVHVQNNEDRLTACRAADGAGLYGTRIYISTGDPARRLGRQLCRRGRGHE